MTRPVRILSIAGSDASGGAGIQADIKTVSALGGYAMTAITALTAQNTLSVEAVIPVEIDFLEKQIRMCLEDIGADAIKIGMLPSVDAVVAVCNLLDELAAGIPVVFDPVMSASTGRGLTDPSAVDVIKSKLVPRSEVITPNTDEATLMTGVEISNPDDMKKAGEFLLQPLGANAALVTGGHLSGDSVTDVLVHQAGGKMFSAPRLSTQSTHGTGCTLSSALATELAFGSPLEVAVENAITFVRRAIETAPGLGAGNGPLNHQFGVTRPEN